MRVLLIEDEATLSDNIRDALVSDGVVVETTYDGLLADRLLKKETFDCVIMDINLPGKNGYELCAEFRSYNTQTPVLMLTAFGELEDKIKGFDCGADDYLTKPFYMRELLVRIQSLVKRSQVSFHDNADRDVITASDLTIFLPQKKVTRRHQEINLTPREYQILLKLCRNKGEIIPKNELVKEIWGNALDVNTNTIEVYINFLRKKIDKPFGTHSIKTKVGYGYYFDID